MNEPTTAVGKRLLARHIDCQGYCEVWAERDAIAAIEAEAEEYGRAAGYLASHANAGRLAEKAVAAERERITRRLANLRDDHDFEAEGVPVADCPACRVLAAVLAIVNPAREPVPAERCLSPRRERSR